MAIILHNHLQLMTTLETEPGSVSDPSSEPRALARVVFQRSGSCKLIADRCRLNALLLQPILGAAAFPGGIMPTTLTAWTLGKITNVF